MKATISCVHMLERTLLEVYCCIYLIRESISFAMSVFFMVVLLQVLCAWDIFEHVLVQKITVKFPFSQRLPDHGPSVLHVLPTNSSLCVLCNEYIAEFKVGSTTGAASKQSVWSVTSHEHPLCAALYNAHFHQVKLILGHD